MPAGGISQEGRLCLKVLIVIPTEGIVVNKGKEHEIGIGKRQIKSFKNSENIIVKVNF